MKFFKIEYYKIKMHRSNRNRYKNYKCISIKYITPDHKKTDFIEEPFNRFKTDKSIRPSIENIRSNLLTNSYCVFKEIQQKQKLHRYAIKKLQDINDLIFNQYQPDKNTNSKINQKDLEARRGGYRTSIKIVKKVDTPFYTRPTNKNIPQHLSCHNSRNISPEKNIQPIFIKLKNEDYQNLNFSRFKIIQSSQNTTRQIEDLRKKKLLQKIAENKTAVLNNKQKKIKFKLKKKAFKENFIEKSVQQHNLPSSSTPPYLILTGQVYNKVNKNKEVCQSSRTQSSESICKFGDEVKKYNQFTLPLKKNYNTNLLSEKLTNKNKIHEN